MDARELIGKRVENEHGRVGTIIAISKGGKFAVVSYPDGYEGRADEGPCVLTVRVEDLIPKKRRVWVKGYRNKDAS